MTRPIKFRAWDKEERRMRFANSDEYVIRLGGGFLGSPTRYLALGFNGTLTERESGNANSNQERTDDFVLMQFTGLLDKNGKEIYEGDIVGIDRGYGPVTYAVVWYRKGWGLQINDNYSFDEGIRAWAKSEVIGNIYENPELLKS